VNKLIISILLFICFNANATNYYAKPGGGAAASCVDSTTNVCTLNRAISVAGDTDVINLAAGNYIGTELGASGYVLMTSKTPDLICAGTRTCNLQPSVATAGIRIQTPPDNSSITISGIVVDGLNGTSPNYCIWAMDDATGTYTLNVNDSSCLNPVFYGIYSAATGININTSNFIMTATSAVHGRSYLYTERSATKWASGTISISGGSVQIDSHNIPSSAAINIEANAAGLTAIVDGWTGLITLDPTLTSTGEHSCVQLLNVANPTIKNSSCTVNGNVGSRSTALFRINSCGNLAGQGCDGTETPRAISNALIRNVTGVNGTTGGYGIVIGQDATSSADNQITNAIIDSSNITCTVPATNGHGIMLGYLIGGNVNHNKVDSCSINFIGKKISTTPSFYSGNISINATGQHYRAKGALITFAQNDAISLSGSGNLYYADQETISGTNSTVSLYNNIGYVNGSTPSYNVFIANSSTLTSSTNNDWYGFATWFKAGSTYNSLATWNGDASVGTDLNVDPLFIGGASPKTSDGYRLSANSTIRRVGLDLNLGHIQDYGNRAFLHPPSIGAWEAASGDETTRTARP